MPEVSCPITDCDYKTPDLEASIVTVLMEAHCKAHDNTLPSNLSTKVSQDQAISIPSEQLIQKEKKKYTSMKGLVIGLVLCVISLALDFGLAFTNQFWYKRVDQLFSANITTTVGLWTGCVVTETKIEETKQCWDHGDKGFPFNYMFVGAAQVLQCLGVIFLACSVITIVTNLTIARDRVGLVYCAAMYALWGGVCFAGSSAVVGPGLKQISTEDMDYRNDVGLSSGIAIVSGIVALIAGAVLLSKFVTTEIAMRIRADPNYKRMEEEDNNL